MKAMKFKVENSDQSEYLQKALFKSGYSWSNRSGENQECQHTKSKYLFTSTVGQLTHGSGWDTFHTNTPDHERCDTESYIKANSNFKVIITPEDYKKPDVALVEVLGNIYKKSEVVEALSKLNRYTVEK